MGRVFRRFWCFGKCVKQDINPRLSEDISLEMDIEIHNMHHSSLGEISLEQGRKLMPEANTSSGGLFGSANRFLEYPNALAKGCLWEKNSQIVSVRLKNWRRDGTLSRVLNLFLFRIIVLRIFIDDEGNWYEGSRGSEMCLQMCPAGAG